MHTRDEQRINRRWNTHRVVLDARDDAACDEFGVRQHLRDELGVGDSPMNIEDVLDAKVVHAIERSLIHDQVSRDEGGLSVTQSPESAEDALAALGCNQHIGVSAWALPVFCVVGVGERSAFEYQRHGAAVLQRAKDPDELSNPDRVGED